MEKEKTLSLEQDSPKQLINQMWRAMVGGFQDVDPMLATKWGVHQPTGFVGEDTSNPGLSMYCDQMALSVTVEYSYTAGVYLISSKHDDRKQIEPISAVLTPEEIAPAIIRYMETYRNGGAASSITPSWCKVRKKNRPRCFAVSDFLRNFAPQK